MAKNRNRYLSRGSQGELRRSFKNKRLKAKNKKKYKKQKFISKISRDGKIDKKEAKKAAKKGISLRTIRNQNIDRYREAGRFTELDNSGRKARLDRGNGRFQERPYFDPLKISRGAEKTFATPQTPAPAAQTDPQTTAPVSQDTTADTPPVEVAEAPDYGQMIADSNAAMQQRMEQMMASNQAAADQRAAQYEAQLNEAREAQLAAQAEYKRQAEEQRRQFELAQRTSLGNQARAGQQANYQLGGAPGMRRGGTFGFRRRRRQLMGGINTSSAFGGVLGAAKAAIAGTLNV